MNRRLPALSVLFVLFVLAGWSCSPERLRPGPPTITLEVPVGSTVFSPDTLPVGVIANDPNGLDSVVVRMLGETRAIDAFAEVELIDVVLFAIPDGLQPGQLLSIFARATDLTGQETVTETSVTVIARPPNAR